MKIPFLDKKPESPPPKPGVPVPSKTPMRLSVAVKQEKQSGFFGALLGQKDPVAPAKIGQETLVIEAPVAKVSKFGEFIKPFKEEARNEFMWLLRKFGVDTSGYEDAATVAYRKMRGWE
jgi:hypothetical protein